MSVYAPTSEYDVAVYEKAVGQVRKVLWEATGMEGNSLLPCGRLQPGDGSDGKEEERPGASVDFSAGGKGGGREKGLGGRQI